MKRLLIFLLLLLLSVQSWALNLPSISTENLGKIQEARDFAVKNGLTTLPGFAFRIDSGMPEALKGSTINLYAHQRAGAILTGYPVVYVAYTNGPNSKCVRAIATVPGSEADTSLWATWPGNPNCKNGVPIEFRAGLQSYDDQLYLAFDLAHTGVLIRQLENEPGKTLDADNDPNAADYASISKEIRDFLKGRALASSGVLASPPWETQNDHGVLNQIAAEDKSYWSRFTYQSINEYRYGWRTSDTPVKWAQRFWSMFTDFVTKVWWPGLKILLSEVAAIGAPANMRLDCYKALMRYKPARVAYACWFDYGSSGWAIQ